MWVVYFTNGRVASSEDCSWLDLSRPREVRGAVYDCLVDPAVEICFRYGAARKNDLIAWQRIKAPTREGTRFFHYLRARFNVSNGAQETMYHAAGYFFGEHDTRIVFEAGPNWNTVRVEEGAPEF